MLKHLCMRNLRKGKQAVAHTLQNSSGDMKGLRKTETCLNNPVHTDQKMPLTVLGEVLECKLEIIHADY